MKSLKNTKKSLVLALLLSACSHAPSIQEYPNTASAKDEVAKLEGDMNKAQTEYVDVLSPNNMKSARAAFNDARSSLDKQKDAKDTLHEVAKARGYLTRSYEFAQLSRSNIGDVVIAREQALAAGAREVRPDEFEDADEALVDVTEDIEKNKLDAAIKNRSALQLRYLELELQSIKQTRIGPARNTINQALKEGAKTFAPRSLAIAEKSFKDTEAFITGNRHDTAQIATHTAETLKTADHVLKITRDSKSGKKTSSEDTALQMESEQAKVAVKQGQLNVKQGQLNDKNNELSQKQDQVERGEAANQALVVENSNLESEQASNQRFEDARAEFTKSEAEVYKQGNKLTIRLRSLEFPVSQAVLKSSNFPLLAKVQKVINSFGKSVVTVEGHTDSSGDKAFNQKLSTERAEAVSSYLTTNTLSEQASFTSIGYGYQKPLATNKTVAGRAQNRRVDITIQPVASTLR